MITTLRLSPGITLRCFRDHRFKQACLSVQLVRPMDRGEAAMNALLSAVLLRGCQGYGDLRSITDRLDELYGASVGTLVRRVGDYQTTGLYCSFIEDRYAMDGGEVLAPMADFVRLLLRKPVLEKGVFRAGYVESEKRNLISTIESQLNDKRAYCAEQLLKTMCRDDSFGIPRLGEIRDVQSITPTSLYEHYQNILRTSRVDVFYAGSAPADAVASLLDAVFKGLDRDYVNLSPQTAFFGCEGGAYEEAMDIAQGKLCMGFVTPTTLRDEGFVAMQLLNLILGGGMTNKLFDNIREKMSLCYDIGSGFYGAKGIMTVSAGIDCSQKERVRQEILRQLKLCQNGSISATELESAKQALYSGLRATHDSPGSIENYYANAALSGMPLTPAGYMAAVEQATVTDVVAAARTLTLHTEYFLKGVSL